LALAIPAYLVEAGDTEYPAIFGCVVLTSCMLFCKKRRPVIQEYTCTWLLECRRRQYSSSLAAGCCIWYLAASFELVLYLGSDKECAGVMQCTISQNIGQTEGGRVYDPCSVAIFVLPLFLGREAWAKIVLINMCEDPLNGTPLPRAYSTSEKTSKSSGVSKETKISESIFRYFYFWPLHVNLRKPLHLPIKSTSHLELSCKRASVYIQSAYNPRS
jgi:hypothetical protein